LDAIVSRAQASQTGARALQSVMEQALMPHMFNLRRYRTADINQITLTQDLVNNPRELSI